MTQKPDKPFLLQASLCFEQDKDDEGLQAVYDGIGYYFGRLTEFLNDCYVYDNPIILAALKVFGTHLEVGMTDADKRIVDSICKSVTCIGVDVGELRRQSGENDHS